MSAKKKIVGAEVTRLKLQDQSLLTSAPAADQSSVLETELLILPDGRIFTHNLTQPFADLLRTLNPDDAQIQPRSRRTAHRTPRILHPAK